MLDWPLIDGWPRVLSAAGTAAGMTITYVKLPGGHDWRVWGAGLVLAVPWLASRTGLVVR